MRLTGGTLLVISDTERGVTHWVVGLASSIGLVYLVGDVGMAARTDA